jgi:hypothetical protein
MTKTQEASTQAYGLIVGGYRVRFTNWKEGRDEWFFGSKEDAQDFAAKRTAYGYKATIETIHFHIKAEM